MSDQTIIRTENIKYNYIRRDEDGNVAQVNVALDGVSIDVRRGAFIAILGANGSGKSTFARTLNALLVPDKGTVYVDGIDTADKERVFDIRCRVGMVFQNPDNQMIGQIVEEEVAFGPENLGMDTATIRQRVDTCLLKTGMAPLSLESVNRLSGGQKQRVSIAGVLAMQPLCIVLDEATAMLDPQGRQEVIDAVKELNTKENITVLMVTHHMEEAVYADHVYCMEKGKVAFHGTPKEVFSQIGRMEELHLTVPVPTKMAFLLRQRGLKLPDGILTATQLLDELFLSRERSG